MPQWFLSFSELPEITEFNESSAPFRENHNDIFIFQDLFHCSTPVTSPLLLATGWSKTSAHWDFRLRSRICFHSSYYCGVQYNYWKWNNWLFCQTCWVFLGLVLLYFFNTKICSSFISYLELRSLSLIILFDFLIVINKCDVLIILISQCCFYRYLISCS